MNTFGAVARPVDSCTSERAMLQGLVYIVSFIMRQQCTLLGEA